MSLAANIATALGAAMMFLFHIVAHPRRRVSGFVSGLRMRPATLAVLALLATSLLAAGADTALRELWRSGAYKSNPLPKVWRPKRTPPTVRDVAAFLGFRSRSIFITNFVVAYGLPDRYLVTEQREGRDFLIYDLPEGHTAALYVPKPPAGVFGAVVVLDRRGDLVKLIK